MAASTIPSPCPKSNLTRRTALRMLPTIGALPVGAAIGPLSGVACAAELPADPGLAQLEEGYARWSALRSEMHRLDGLSLELFRRAEAAVLPFAPPLPPIAPEIAPLMDRSGFAVDGWWKIPESLQPACHEFSSAMVDWRVERNKLFDGQPDFEAHELANEQARSIQEEAFELRDGLLAIPTTSPRGVLLKLAIAVEATTDAEIEDALDVCDWDLTCVLSPIVPDLRAMAGEVRS